MFNKLFVSGVMLVSTLLSGELLAQSKPLTLTFYNWEDFVDQSLIDEWEATTGIKIQQVFYDDEAERNLVLSGNANNQMDVVVVDNPSVKILSGAGHLYPIKKQADRETYWPSACGAYGRQYLWGSFGLVYRKDMLSEVPTGWKSLFNPSPELSGHLGMLGLADELIIPALLSLGYSSNETGEKELREAFELLKVQAQHVRTYEYIYTYVVSHPEQQDVWIAPAYSGDQDGLNQIQGDGLWHYILPEEGTIVWVDCLAISANSRNKEEAQAFIDFLTSKENSARSSETLWVASPYLDTKALVDEEVLNDQTVYLNSKMLDKATLFKSLKGSDMLQRTRIKDALIRYHDSN